MATFGSESNTPAAEVDLTRLKEISGGDIEFEREIAGEYIGQAWGLLAEIAQAVEAGDPEAQRRTAHTLKGSSRTVGAMGVAALAAQLESLGGGRDAVGTAARLESARACLEATQVALDGYFGSDEYRRAA